MRFSATFFVALLAAETAVASSWLSKAAYNKWHETELERWLSDHNVPYPAAADRKELTDLVSKNWDDNVARPYNTWDTNQLSSYLSSQGQQVKKGTEKNKDSLVEQVQKSWKQTNSQASDAYSSVQNWIFDSWTESQLKAYLDYYNIPNPNPRTRDSLLSTARANYQKAADKAGETAAYPGDWLYQSWSDSDLKSWLDERGVPAPQPNTRDKLIASIRRNSYVASNRAAEGLASASSSASDAQSTLTDKIISAWDDTKLKQFLDENNVKIPQGSKHNELLALARKYRAQLTGDNVSASAASAYGAATSSAGNAYAGATNDLYSQGKYWYDWALAQVGMGSEEAKASLSSVSSSASASLSSASKVASSSSSSASKVASSSASSASSVGSKSASSGSSKASKSASSAKNEL